MFNSKNLEKMKKKFFGILLGLFMSVGLAYPTCAVTLSCKTVMTVCMEYFLQGTTTQDYWNAAGHYLTYLVELEVSTCPQDPLGGDEPEPEPE